MKLHLASRPSLAVALLLLSVIVSTQAANIPQQTVEKEKYCGLAIGTGWERGAYWGQKLTNALYGVRNTNSNIVQFSFYIQQVGLNGTKSTYFSDVNELVHSIARAKQAGFKVFLKPVVDVRERNGNYSWRGNIKGSTAWFNSVYIPFITRMARIAQQHKVDIFAVGSELRDSEHRVDQWKRVIQIARREFKGKLTYVANHDSYFKIKFFHLMDIVSVSAYFRLLFTDKAKIPTYEQTVGLFKWRATRIQRWLKATGLTDKGVLIAEVGFQSKAGLVNYRYPWDWDFKSSVSYAAQAKMYRAFISAFMSRDWCLGAIFWHWEMDAIDVGGYTPQGKPAEAIIRKTFASFC